MTILLNDEIKCATLTLCRYTHKKAWACLFLSLGSRQAFVEEISTVHAFLFVGKIQFKTQYMSIDEIEQRSFEFIEQHIDATFDEVPEYLFKIWHIPVPLKDYLSVNYKDKYEYRIFLFALRKYCKTYNRYVPEEQTLSLFKVYQLMLSIPIVRGRHLPRETAFRIFDFNFYLELI